MKARARATKQGIETSGARALLSVVRNHDEAPAWDWKHQREQSGVPSVMVRGYSAEDPEAIVSAIESLRAAS